MQMKGKVFTMDTAPETLTLSIPSEKGDKALCTLTVEYDEEAQVLSALHQLWTMPEMQMSMEGQVLNAYVIGQKKSNGLVTDVSRMLRGVDEAAFCSNFFHCGANELTLFQSFKKPENALVIEANIPKKTIVMKMFGGEAPSVLDEIQKFLMQTPHQVPLFLQNCSHTANFSSYYGPNCSPEEAIQKLFRALKKKPDLSGTIMVAEEGDTEYRMANDREPNISWIYAMNLNKKFFLAYHTGEDMLTASHVRLPHEHSSEAGNMKQG